MNASRLIIKYFINGGGTSPYDLIAQELGWRLGMNSGGNKKPKVQLKMIDNDFQNYHHETHVNSMVQSSLQ